MAKNIVQYDLLISCPGDANDVVKIVNDVIEEFNQQFSDTIGISIRTRHWSKSAYAESGGKPQQILNKQIVDPSDLAVAIFKNRFGTPTDEYGSGTEEEIEKMLAGGKQVFMYFDERPVSPSLIDMREYEKVQAFKEKYKEKGIYYSFSDLVTFRNYCYAHVTRYFLTLNKSQEDANKPELVIKASVDNRIESSISILPFDMGKCGDSEKIETEIYEMLQKINTMPLNKGKGEDRIFVKKIELSQSAKNTIKMVAEKMKIALSESFFDVGNLGEFWISSNPLFGKDISGTETEKSKYNALLTLQKKINILCGRFQLEEYYKDLFGVKLILVNEGTDYDEDIDVELIFPREKYIDSTELIVPSEEICIDDEWNFSDIFEISSSKDYICFDDTKRMPIRANYPVHLQPDLFGNKDIEEGYRETIAEIFDEYQVYDDCESTIVKVHFDFLKQHQSAAFPTWLFVKKAETGFILKYRIISKRNSGVVEKTVHVKGMEGKTSADE